MTINTEIILEEFINSRDQIKWLKFTHFKVLIRDTKRVNPTTNEMGTCLDIANSIITNSSLKEELFIKWLYEVKDIAIKNNFELLYIEDTVIPESFQPIKSSKLPFNTIIQL